MQPHSNITSRKRTWVVVLAGIASMMAALDTVVVSTALSTLRVHLHASVAQLEWTVNAYNLSFAVLLITGAALGDRFGRRRLYAVGLALFAAASAVSALAPDVGWLIGARAVQGAGAALIMPLGLALLSAAFPPERRGAAIGIFSAITGVAVALGPLVGGAVVEGINWQWIFWLNVPIGLLAIPFVLSKMKESHGPDTGLDLRGLALVTTGTLGIVWGLMRGNQIGWTSVELIASLAVGALLLAGFIAWDLDTLRGWPYFPAIGAGILVAVVAGLLRDREDRLGQQRGVLLGAGGRLLLGALGRLHVRLRRLQGAGRGRLRELARDEVVAQVALGDVDDRAALAELVHVLEEDRLGHARVSGGRGRGRDRRARDHRGPRPRTAAAPARARASRPGRSGSGGGGRPR